MVLDYRYEMVVCPTMTERLTVAGVPHHVGFATKPALAQSLITEAVNASVPASWVPGTRSTAQAPSCASTCHRPEC
jgi:hypothetical protein